MRRLRRAARSASSCNCAAERSVSPSDTGDVLEQTSISGTPSSCIRSNLRSARSRLRLNNSSGMPSKSRNGWYRSSAKPRSAAIERNSFALPLKLMKSLSNSSIASNRAAAAASSFWRKVPLSETVAIDLRMSRSSQGNEGPLPSLLDPLGGPDAKRQVWGRAVGDPGSGAQFVGRRVAEAEELEVGRDHLEQH